MRDPVRSFIIAPFQPDLALLGADLATRPQTLVIVPRAALGRELRRAANAARIVTWLDLARDLAPAAAAARGFLGEDAAAWIVRGLRPASQRARTIFDGVLSERGFRAELLRAFLDLAAAGLASAVEAERFLVQQAMDLPRPVRHVLELYVQWRRGFEATHDDRAARLRAAAAAARAGGAPAALQARHVVFFGRPELDAMEMDLVAALALDAELDLVFLAPPAPGDTEHLPAWFASRGFTIENRAPAKPRAVIAGISAPSPELEGVEVARRILAAVDEGILFAEMAVVARTPVRLEPVARALERAGVPHGRAAGAPVAATRAGRALSALLELIESGEPLDAALLFLEVAPLAPGALGLDEEAMPAAWERVAREARLGRAPSAWDTRLARFATQQEQRAERQRGAGEPAARAATAAAAAASLRTAWLALRAELAALPRSVPWPDHIAALRSLVERLFAPGGERDAVIATIERLQALAAFGDGPVKRVEFHAALRAALAEPQPATEIQGVTLGTASALHGLSFRMVCLVGMEEGEWPAAPAEDPVLPAEARAWLAARLPQAGSALAPRSFARARERRWALDAAAAASDVLVLAWTRLDPQTGAARSESTLVQEIAALHPNHGADWFERVPLRRQSLPENLPVLDLAEFDELAAASLPRRAARAYVRRLGNAAARGLVLEALRTRRRRFTLADGMLTTRAARAALARRLDATAYSATLLRDYLACPFRSFMRQLLRLQSLEAETDRLPSPAAVGRLAHRILEQFHRGLHFEGLDLAGLDAAARRARLDAVAARVRAAALDSGEMGRTLPWEITWTRLIEDLRTALRREAQAAAAEPVWQPIEFEARFGPGRRPAMITPPEGGAAIALSGSMDRLDVRTAGGGVRVIDYKSGREPRDANQEALQLALYLHVATAGDVELLRRSEAQFAYVTRRGSHAIRSLHGTALAARPGDLAQLVAGIAGGMRSGAFFPQPGPNGEECEFCDYRAVCDARVVAQAVVKQRAGQAAWLAKLPRFRLDEEAGT